MQFSNVGSIHGVIVICNHNLDRLLLFFLKYVIIIE